MAGKWNLLDAVGLTQMNKNNKRNDEALKMLERSNSGKSPVKKKDSIGQSVSLANGMKDK